MSWSGSFTNEVFQGPGVYQAKNGVRCLVDMETTPGPVTILTPIGPTDNSSFVLHWNNPTRELLSIDTPDLIEKPTIAGVPSASASVSFQRGTLAFVYFNGIWQIFDWAILHLTLRTSFAVAWEGRNTNGLCTLQGHYKGVEVERTGLGFYTVRLEPGTLASQTMVLQAPVATSLPPETSPELRMEDIGMAVADEILVNAGIRNKNGQFSDNDLIQDPANFMALIGQQFP